MAKRWNNYTRREKAVGLIGALFGVFVIGSIANGISAPAPSTTVVDSTQETSQIKPSTQPITTFKEVTEKQEIAFEKTTVESNLYSKGTTQVTTRGVNGEKTVTYRVTVVDSVESKREIIKDEVTKNPVSEVSSIGTYIKPVVKKQASSNCDPNYSGACVPIASDVDCAGGSGNGPAYVSGPVYIVGVDIYELDRNNDGVGCE